MKFWVAVTHKAWFEYLARLQPDEVNFWQPHARGRFQVLEPGGPFLFKLHSPYDFIVGGGFFVEHSRLPLSLAWDVFGRKNGAPDYASLRSAILKYRDPEGKTDPLIGCIVLSEPFFLPRERWIPIPDAWGRSIVQGKSYTTDEPDGAALWDRVRVAMQQVMKANRIALPVAVGEETPVYGPAYLTRAPLGQGSFRVLVTEAYQRRCAISGERTLPVLEVSHIKPLAACGPQRVDNGLLLRADLRILFQRGYLTVTDDLRVEVSRRIKDEFDNGEQYRLLHGHPLEVVPAREVCRPSADYLRWHNENRFLGR